MLIRVLDFETTGLPEDEGGAAICEVGWCDVLAEDGRNSVESHGPHSLLCNPGRPIPPQVRALHHISDVDVAGSPTPDEVLTRLLSGEPDCFAAHVADFERAFFKVETPWLCTYKIALRYWPEAPAHNNQVLRYWLELGCDDAKAMPPHRAGPDAYVTAHLLVRILDEAKVSIEDMVRWSNGCALLPKVTFGKHKGSKWEELPTDYLEWIVNKSDLDRDAKANARYHLKLRHGGQAA